ncbi:unnamed protein product [Mesocestoides corti]|uniref:B3_4 domain-containing protein n=1 Tax=Mesocestoides corti TaxID=53468 RepID=A0A0R3UJM2_MESCO|nr:unnamed protein product [Mesocestoides corti]
MAKCGVRSMEWPEVATAIREHRRELVVSNHDGMDPLLYSLKQLNFLDISKCGISELSEDVSNLSELTKLSLQHNPLPTLPSGVGLLRNLRFLDISFNCISDLPFTIFDELLRLETLVMDSNKLVSLPSLKGLVDLHHMSVSNNQLCDFPETITECCKIMTIDVSGNRISELPNCLKWENLGNLQRLNLANNKLTFIPEELAECKKLRDLRLSDNPLKDNRLKKLASDPRSGPAVINYIGKSVKGRSRKVDKNGKLTRNSSGQPDLKSCTEEPSAVHALIVSPTTNDEKYFIGVVKPEEIRNSLRPRIFACVVSGISLSAEGVLPNFMRFQTKLHNGLGEQRRVATFCTHDLKHVTLPLKFSLQSVDFASIQPLNMAKVMTARQLLARLQLEAESERKRRKMTQFSSLMRYLEIISPLLGPGRETLNAAAHAEFQPLPVTTDAAGVTLSLHPLTGCHQTRLSRETTSTLIEVAGTSDEVCKKIIRALIGWLVHNARPSSEDEVPPSEGASARSAVLTVSPITVVNAESKAPFSKYPTTADIENPEFLNVDV